MNDPLACTLTGKIMTDPMLAPCGHSFEHGSILKHQYCPIHKLPISPGTLRMNLIAREIIFRTLVDKENAERALEPHRFVLLSLTYPSKGKDYRENNLYYEFLKRVSGWDLHYKIPLLDPIYGQALYAPVMAPCQHTFDSRSIPEEGILCPFDGTPITRESLYPNLFITSYLESLHSKPLDVPYQIEGVYLDLPLSITMNELKRIAKTMIGLASIEDVCIFDGTEFLPGSRSLKHVLCETGEDIIPYIFAFKNPLYSCLKRD